MGMVAIGMGVDNDPDIVRCHPGRIRHHAQHLAGQAGIEQGIDEQRFAAIGDQAGIGPAPAAIGLQIGVKPEAGFNQTLFKRNCHHLFSRIMPHMRHIVATFQ